jgi:hypothetical protein
MNNSVFGKTVENVYKRKDVRLKTNANEAIKLTSKPQYQDFRQFNDELYGIMMKKFRVNLDKPVQVGFAVLELSKLLMLEFYYDHFKQMYPQARILYTDTDSFILDVPTEDVYQDMLPLIDKWYDTSDYPKDNPLHTNKNKKVLGKFKDELSGKIITEYIGLRAKMYSVKVKDGAVIKKHKGISKTADIKHENYIEALFDERVFYHANVKIGSSLHQVNTTVVEKKSLVANDTKRIQKSPYFSYAIGHWRTLALGILDEIVMITNKLINTEQRSIITGSWKRFP